MNLCASYVDQLQLVLFALLFWLYGGNHRENLAHHEIFSRLSKRLELKALAAFCPPYHHCMMELLSKRTDVNVAILVESVNDEGEDEANVAGVVIS